MVSDEIITQIADRLAIPVSEIYHIFVDAQSTLALIYVIGVIVIIGTPTILYMGARRWLDDINHDADVLAGCILFGLLVGFILYYILYYILTALLIPEYTAIHQLISILT